MAGQSQGLRTSCANLPALCMYAHHLHACTHARMPTVCQAAALCYASASNGVMWWCVVIAMTRSSPCSSTKCFSVCTTVCGRQRAECAPSEGPDCIRCEQGALGDTRAWWAAALTHAVSWPHSCSNNGSSDPATGDHLDLHPVGADRVSTRVPVPLQPAVCTGCSTLVLVPPCIPTSTSSAFHAGITTCDSSTAN
jgi:hypothetical protein